MIQIADRVQHAISAGRAVVALESTVIAHGLPFPQNQAVAHALEDEVRALGAVPATIGVVAGVPTVGMSADDILRFAQPPLGAQPLKLARRDLAYAVAGQRDGATTVSATMMLAAAAGIGVFATGGIGGVHRGATQSWDISADLTELARTPVLVVCAGAKAILDLPATLEYLETAGVPVIGFQTAEFPAFYSRKSGLPVLPAADEHEVARIWRAHRALGGAGVLVCVPPPEAFALEPDIIEAAIQRALARAEAQQVRGPAVTPFLLAAVADESGGESILANVALLRQNARVAALIAGAIQQV